MQSGRQHSSHTSASRPTRADELADWAQAQGEVITDDTMDTAAGGKLGEMNRCSMAACCELAGCCT